MIFADEAADQPNEICMNAGRRADYVAALTTRINGVRLVVSGGVGSDNIVDYVHAGAFAIAVGGRLFTSGDLRNENYAAIAERARGILRLAGVA